MQETWFLSLGWDDPLEEGMATHSRILAWRLLWTEVPGGLQSMGLKEPDTTEQLSTAQQSNNNSWYSLSVTGIIRQALPSH